VGYDDARVRLKMQFILAAQKLLEGGESDANPFRLRWIPQSTNARFDHFISVFISYYFTKKFVLLIRWVIDNAFSVSLSCLRRDEG
jgi:hypothetical protein